MYINMNWVGGGGVVLSFPKLFFGYISPGTYVCILELGGGGGMVLSFPKLMFWLYIAGNICMYCANWRQCTNYISGLCGGIYIQRFKNFLKNS
jgi:hypothetical protein